jgi:hypothetical protein
VAYFEVLIFNLTMQSYENNLNRQQKGSKIFAKNFTFSPAQAIIARSPPAPYQGASTVTDIDEPQKQKEQHRPVGYCSF